MLAEKEEALKIIQIEKSRLELQSEHLESRVRVFDESEQRFKEENWNLELANQDLAVQSREQAEQEERLQAEILRLCHEKEEMIKELDEWKHQNDKLYEDLEAEHKHHEVEFATMRRNLATNESERLDLEKKVEDLKQELEESHSQSIRLRASLEHRSEKEENSDPFGLQPAQRTPEHSPPPSPTKPTPRHTHLESETLKSSLQHAHRMITNLKSNIHREKSEKSELRRLLQEARDELETARQRRDSLGGPPSSADRRRKGKGAFMKSGSRPIFNTTLLGGPRRPRDEVTMVENLPVEDEWEEAPDEQPSPTRSSFPVLRDYTLSPPSLDPEESAFETADETAGEKDTTDAFETANEQEGTATETEAYRTGNESPVNDYPTSADELTETEQGTALLQVIQKKSSRASSFGRQVHPMKLNKMRHRDSVASTASTDDESDEAYMDGDDALTRDSRRDRHDAFMTPVAASNQRLKLKINRARSRGSRMTSQSSMFSSKERAFSAGSSNRDRAFSAGSSEGGYPQRSGSPASLHKKLSTPGERKSLFAELEDGMLELDGGDGEDDETAEEDEILTTPTRDAMPLMPFTIKPEMVDCGIMTDVSYPDILEHPELERSRSSLGVGEMDRPRTAMSVITMDTIEERLVTTDVGTQSEKEPEPVKIEMLDVAIQSEEELKPVLTEMGMQSDEIPVPPTPEMTEMSTQFDPELEKVEEVAVPMVEMGTQSDPEPEEVKEKDRSFVPIPLPLPIPASVPDLSDELHKAEADLKAAEEKLRLAHEAGRLAEEKLRQAEEGGKLAAERLLQSDEAGKLAAERLLQSDEAARLATGKLLQSDEAARLATEKLRQAEEDEKLTKEKLRQAEEAGRLAEEKLCQVEESRKTTAEKLLLAEEGGKMTVEKLRHAEEGEKLTAEKLLLAEEGGRLAEEKLLKAVEDEILMKEKLRQAEEDERLTKERLHQAEEDGQLAKEAADRNARDYAKAQEEVSVLKPIIVALEEEIEILKEERDSLQETVSTIPVLDMKDTGVQFDPELEQVEKEIVVEERIIYLPAPVATPGVAPVSAAGTQTTTEEKEVAFGSTQTTLEESIPVEYTVVVDKVAEVEPSIPEPTPEMPLEFSKIQAQDTIPIEPEPTRAAPPVAAVVPVSSTASASIPAVDASVSSDDETPKKVSENVEDTQQRPTTPSPEKPSGFFGSMFGGWKRPGSPAHESEGLKGANDRTFSTGTFGPAASKDRQLEAPTVEEAKASDPVPTSDQEVQTDITYEFFENIATAKTIDKGKRPAFAVVAPEPMYIGDRSSIKTPSLRSHTSHDSFGLNKTRGDPSHVLPTGGVGAIRRPGSSTSLREYRATHPPLPSDHKEHIIAAQQKTPEIGTMGPPPVPSSSTLTQRNNVTFRPRTPVNDTIKPVGPETPGSKAGTTPRPRFSATRSEVSSPTSRRSSLSSFVSELDSRFNIAPEAVASEAQTDPRMIQAITQTMIGEYLWKYTRSAGRGTLSHSRHKRFFWVHPYTRTLYWSDRDPTTAGRAELRAKSVAIEAVRVVTDDNPMPPGLHRKSLVIVTPGRSLKFTAPTGQRHETWFNVRKPLCWLYM